MIKPISPDDVAAGKLLAIPDDIIATFNALIAKHFSDGKAVVKQRSVMEALKAKGHDPSQVFSNNWLDIEPIYQAEGWHVEYEKPGYNESGGAFFTFAHKGES